MSTTTRTRTALGAGLTAALLALTACGGDGGEEPGGGSADNQSSASPGSSEAQQSGPDVEGIPEVVAEVNGEQINRDEFVAIYQARVQQATAQAQMSGEEPDQDALKEQTVQGLVDTELLRQEAAERGIGASDEAVDRKLTSLAKQNQLASARALLNALQEQGTSKEQVRTQIETQLLVEGLVADEAGGDIKPTEQDLRKLYQQVKQQQAQSGQQGGQAIPPFGQVRSQLKEQAVSQEQGRVTQSLVGELSKDADISINL
jgi:peptidyl-prolyl cis-trans isomerase SurA